MVAIDSSRTGSSEPPALPLRRLSTFVALAVGAALTGAVAPATAQCITPAPTAVSAYFNDSIALELDPRLPRSVAEEAMGYWRRCANYGVGFPELVVGRDATRTVSVEFHPTEMGADRCGSFMANRIDLYLFSRDESGRIYDCGSLAQNLAHEIGHLLGLADAPSAPACRRHVMSDIHDDNAHRRAVQEIECQVVGQRWLTSIERGAFQRRGAEGTRRQAATLAALADTTGARIADASAPPAPTPAAGPPPGVRALHQVVIGSAFLATVGGLPFDAP